MDLKKTTKKNHQTNRQNSYCPFELGESYFIIILFARLESSDYFDPFLLNIRLNFFMDMNLGILRRNLKLYSLVVLSFSMSFSSVPSLPKKDLMSWSSYQLKDGIFSPPTSECPHIILEKARKLSRGSTEPFSGKNSFSSSFSSVKLDKAEIWSEIFNRMQKFYDNDQLLKWHLERHYAKRAPGPYISTFTGCHFKYSFIISLSMCCLGIGHNNNRKDRNEGTTRLNDCCIRRSKVKWAPEPQRRQPGWADALQQHWSGVAASDRDRCKSVG